MSWGAVAAAAAPYVMQGVGSYMNSSGGGAADSSAAKKQAKLAKKFRKQYMQSYNEALAANKQRGQEINSQLGALRTRSLANLDKVGAQEQADIKQNYTDLGSNANQDLVSRGLGGTTVKQTVDRSTAQGMTDAQNRSTDQISQQRAATDQQLTAAQQAFQERITDGYPSPDMVETMLKLGQTPNVDLAGANYADILGAAGQAITAGYGAYQQSGGGSDQTTQGSNTVQNLTATGGAGASGGAALEKSATASSPEAKAAAAGVGTTATGTAQSLGAIPNTQSVAAPTATKAKSDMLNMQAANGAGAKSFAGAGGSAAPAAATGGSSPVGMGSLGAMIGPAMSNDAGASTGTGMAAGMGMSSMTGMLGGGNRTQATGMAKKKKPGLGSKYGGLAGTVAGGIIGSIVPGFGTVIGAGIGGALGTEFGPMLDSYL